MKENLQIQVRKWKENKKYNPTLAYMEVQIESLKQLKTEAFKLATKLKWTPESFGISSVELDELIIEISLKIAESKKSERLNEAKNKKLSDQISAKGPQINLPKLTSPVDILQWVCIFRKLTAIVDSDLSKLALVK